MQLHQVLAQALLFGTVCALPTNPDIKTAVVSRDAQSQPINPGDFHFFPPKRAVDASKKRDAQVEPINPGDFTFFPPKRSVDASEKRDPQTPPNGGAFQFFKGNSARDATAKRDPQIAGPPNADDFVFFPPKRAVQERGWPKGGKPNGGGK